MDLSIYKSKKEVSKSGISSINGLDFHNSSFSHENPAIEMSVKVRGENVRETVDEAAINEAYGEADIEIAQPESISEKLLEGARKKEELRQSLKEQKKNLSKKFSYKEQKEIDIDRETALKSMHQLLDFDSFKGVLWKDDKGFVEKGYKLYGSLVKKWMPNYEAALKKVDELPDISEDQKERFRIRIELLGEIKKIYEAKEALIENKYYALLDEKDMNSLTREDLMGKLRKQYQKPKEERNTELIRYFEALVRIKDSRLNGKVNLANLEATIKKEHEEAKKEETNREVKLSVADEMKRAADTFLSLEARMKEDGVFSEAEYKRRLKNFFSVIGPDIEAYLNQRQASQKNPEAIEKTLDAYRRYYLLAGDDSGVSDVSFLKEEALKQMPEDDAEDFKQASSKMQWAGKDMLSAEQKEGIRQISMWMYRNCNKGYKSKAPFVDMLMNKSKEELLFMMYLVENDKQENPKDTDVYEALYHYTPSLSRFKEQVVASRWKFWKRLPNRHARGAIVDWHKITRANLTAAKHAGKLAVFLSAEREEEETEKAINSKAAQDFTEKLSAGQFDNIKENDPKINELKAQQDLLVKALSATGSKLRLLLASGGLRSDMPIDLLSNENIKKDVKQIMGRIGEILKKLSALQEKLPETVEKKAPQFKEGIISGDKEDEEEEEGSFDRFIEKMDKVNEVGSLIFAPSSVVDHIANYLDIVKKFGELKTYQYSVSGFTLLSGLAGILYAVQGVPGLWKEWSDQTWGGVMESHALNTGAMASSAGYAIDSAKSTAEAYMDGAESEVTEAFGQYAQPIAGGALVLAGAVKSFGGAIEAGRGISGKLDVKNARKKLGKIENKTQEQKKLFMFLQHQGYQMNRKILKGAADFAAGGLMLLCGGLMLKGTVLFGEVLGTKLLTGATLGLNGIEIGIGSFVDRWYKNKNRKRAIDDYLKMDELVRLAKDKWVGNSEIAKMKDDKLRSLIRREVLASLGYASYKEMFRDIMDKYANLIYQKVFVKPDGSYYTKQEHEAAEKQGGERSAFWDAIKSFGIHIRFPSGAPGNKKPNITPEMLLQKLME